MIAALLGKGLSSATLPCVRGNSFLEAGRKEMTGVDYALGKSDEVPHQRGSSRLVPFVLRVVCSLSLQDLLSVTLYRSFIFLYRLSITLYRWSSGPFARAEKS